MITPWKIAMLLILPLMWREWRVRGLDPQKARVWCAMMGGSVASLILADIVPTGTHQLGAYVLLDFLVARLILSHPISLAQKALGALSGVMVLFGVGYLLSVLQGKSNPELYGQAMLAMSWARWAILASWGAGDAVGMAVRRLRVARPALDHRADSR